MTRSRRLLALALLWLTLVAAFAGLAQRQGSILTRIAFEEEMRDEVRAEMTEYALRDSAAWAEDQRRTDRRIAALHRQAKLNLGVMAALAIAGSVAGLWIWRRREPDAT